MKPMDAAKHAEYRALLTYLVRETLQEADYPEASFIDEPFVMMSLEQFAEEPPSSEHPGFGEAASGEIATFLLGVLGGIIANVLSPPNFKILWEVLLERRAVLDEGATRDLEELIQQVESNPNIPAQLRFTLTSRLNKVLFSSRMGKKKDKES